MKKRWENYVFWKATAIRRLIQYLLVFSVVSSVFLLHFVTPAYAIPKQGIGEFLETYDTERDYQPATEPIITPLPGFGGNVGGGGSGVGGNSVGGYYNEQGQWVGEGNVKEIKKFNLEEFEREEAIKAGKPVPTAKPKGVQKYTQPVGNVLGALWNGAKKAAGDIWSTVVKAASSAVGSVAKFVQEKVVVPVVVPVVGSVKNVSRTIATTLSTAITVVSTPIQHAVSQNTFVSQGQIVINNFFGFQISLPAFISKPFITQPTTLTEIKKQEIQDEFRFKVSDGTEKWTLKELELVQETLRELPEGFYKQGHVKEMVRQAKDEELLGSYYPHLHKLEIYSQTSDHNGMQGVNFPDNYKPDLDTAYKFTIAHEFSHGHQKIAKEDVIAFSNLDWEYKTIPVKRTYFNTFYVVQNEKKWVYKNDSSYVSNYAQRPVQEDINYFVNTKDEPVIEKWGNPEEDMAETYGLYFIEPCLVYINSKEKYDFINSRYNNYNNLDCSKYE